MGSGWLVLSLYLCSSMDMAWWITLVFIFFNVSLILDIGILNVLWSVLMEGLWVEALAPTVISINGLTVHPHAWMFFINGWYLAILEATFLGENLAL
jgi:hypothetical protein